MAGIKGDIGKILTTMVGANFTQGDLSKNALTQPLAALLDQYGSAIMQSLRDNLDRKGKNATRNLKQSIVSKPTRIDGSQAILEVEQNEYWKYVDGGRGAGKGAPLGVIEKWIAYKPALKQRIPSLKKQYGIKSDKTAYKTLAFLINRKLKRQGYKGSNYFSEIVNDQLIKNIEDDAIALTKRAITINLVSIK